ncbi:MAG TPA: hypothetical protein DDY32_05845 [Desulfobulbaceae bacterium]|nr:hypothetical protein [Desulfobulbaceae bacterium]
MRIMLSLFIALVFWAGSAAFADQVPRMDKDELKAMLGKEDLVILDVRRGEDWSSSEFKIKDAVRIDNGDLSKITQYPKDKTLVLYCA